MVDIIPGGESIWESGERFPTATTTCFRSAIALKGEKREEEEEVDGDHTTLH